MSKEQCNKLIREKNKHLQELSFGCKIEHAGLGRLTFIAEKYCQNKEHDTQYGCDRTDYCNNLACLDSDNRVVYGNTWTPYKKLGHPIQINDWLGLLPIGYTLGTDGNIYFEHNREGWIYPKYDLSKPFDSQSESFYRFLLENIT